MHNFSTSFIIHSKRKNLYKNIKRERADENMDIKDICNAGGDILNAVADAINRNDYSGLSDKVSDTVNQVVNQVKEEVNQSTFSNQTQQKSHTNNTYHQQNTYQNTYQNQVVRIPRQEIVTRKPAGRIAGPFQLVGGIVGTTGFGITALIMFLILIIDQSGLFIALTIIFGVLTGGSILNIVKGSKKIGLVSRFRHYARVIGNRSYVAIEDLARQTGRERKTILRDLKLMTQKSMFLQGRLDAKETTFMLTDEAYQQYQQAEEARRNREAEESVQKIKMQSQEKKAEKSTTYSSQEEKILQDGEAYIRTVRECNDLIPNEEVSNKLYKLEAIMSRIFEQVKKHPESAEDLHKLMDYYLPTTIKLLNAYIDLDKQDIAGENILATKKEIEDVLDIINAAFEKLLDSMFEDIAWDISSDISVMKTMMAQEGLTENKDFKS